MKKLFKSKLTVFLLIMVLISTSIFPTINAMADPGKKINYKETANMDFRSGFEDISVTVLESDDTHTVVRFDVNNFRLNPVMIDNQEYYSIDCEGTTVLYDEGAPELPRICRSIAIPNDSDARINVVASDYKDYKKFPIAPSKGSVTRDKKPKDIPYTFNKVYKEKNFYPEKLASLSEPFIMRELRGTTITVNPFQYEPSKETLRVYKSITVEITTDGNSSINALTAPDSEITQDFEPTYEKTFINYHDKKNSKDSKTRLMNNPSETGSMLIITYDQFSSALTSFTEWKNSKGINTTVVNMSTVSPTNSPSQIKSYIQNYYNQNPSLTYVLLVGDYAQISSPTYSTGVSDPEYTKVAGSDNYPDIYVGRFSAETLADVETQVRRTLEFEQNGYNTAAWFKKGIGIASDEGSGETDIQHMNIIKNKLTGAGYTQVDSIYDPGATASSVTTSLNNGRGIINYCGHGSDTYWVTTGFSNTNIKNLQQSPGQLPFIISVSCVSGTFQKSTTCFAETWMRSKNASGAPIGAIGTLMSTVNQPWTPPMVGQDKIIDLLCSNSRISLGGLCYSGETAMLDNGTSDDLLTFNTWTLFGDPSIQILPSGTSDTYEPNNTQAEAYAINSGTAYDSLISSASDVDYYTFTINTTGTISATLANLPGDYDFYLYNSAGTQVASSTNGGTTNESISYNATATGKYYLKVIGYNGVYSATSKYRVTATYPTGGTMSWYYETKTYDSPHNYTNNYNGVNEYVKTGATKVQVHFSRFETESGYDYVYIKDKNGTTINKYSGTLSPFWATVDGDKIVINLVTDYSVTKYGYTIDQVAYYAGSQLIVEKVNISGGNLN